MTDQFAMGTSVVWFRGDLRLTDNPALQRAMQCSETVIPVFILDPEEGGGWAMGSAARWWLHHSLTALDQSLRRLGCRLLIRRGPALEVLRRVCAETGAGRVCWNRRYEPWAVELDGTVKQGLRADGLVVESFNGALLAEPWTMKTAGGEPYKVFTPFFKALQKRGFESSIVPAPSSLPPVPAGLTGLHVEELGLAPRIPWDGGLRESWTPGEVGALAKLEQFLNGAMADYAVQRDRPDRPGTSRLSPHLRFGEIGPRQIVAAARSRAVSEGGDAGFECFLRELGWREFAHHLLFHFPDTRETPLDERFRNFPWRETPTESLQAWRKGMTGIPLVDAGMRELWHTGWMHNRVRMVAASLLVKNLGIHWLQGARWFWDTLVDADLANNTLGWQWVAGCGADAAPYFRIFNPVLQGQRFDPSGDYVRRWVPELQELPERYIHQPWEAPDSLLQSCKIELGMNYPRPVVDLKTSRENALAAFHRLGERDAAKRDRAQIQP